ncbi:nitrilotriacetate monooxygenase component A IIA synthase subunit A-2 [Coleophoma cylindrospora]|uniref:Nitrilotriacetate monooxygenase component A IIA synthase subunit A-2 n=1 Tax=Coleophoma cylindrospora TaxID=1849047 RepID=A0A3D8Q5W8_9HELO|nr:nitrilotriacetate monooxygenase component A IIA synthase subunit A-2 [Coleophoma cylindrospora]
MVQPSETALRGKRHMHINFAETACAGSHMGIGQWKRPGDMTRFKDRLDYYVWMAKTAERGKVTAIFFADTYGFFDTFMGSPDPQLRAGTHTGQIDPVTIVGAMAQATKSVGFALTGSTTYLRPFILARTWGSLDHVTDGRIGWNVVTSFGETTAKQMGYKEQMSHDERYEAAHEFMDIVYQLWEKCWEDGVQQWSVEPEMAYDPSKFNKITFDGKYHQFEGYGQTHPSPQRTPVLFQAGNSTAGIDFAGKHAEAIYCGSPKIPGLRDYSKKVRAAAVAHGRDPYDIKLFASMTPIIGRTVEEAEAKKKEYWENSSWQGGLAHFCGYSGIDLSNAPLDEPFDFDGGDLNKAQIQGFVKAFRTIAGDRMWTPREIGKAFAFGALVPKPTGTPEMVADMMEEWFYECDVDGFNLSYFSNPDSFEDIVDLLVPELQKRGIYWDDYPVPGGTFRENMHQVPGEPNIPLRHPGAVHKYNYEELKAKDASKEPTDTGAAGEPVADAKQNTTEPKVAEITVVA